MKILMKTSSKNTFRFINNKLEFIYLPLFYCIPHFILIGIFIGIIILFQFLFKHFMHVNYLLFYIDNGSKLNFGLALIGFSIKDLNLRPNIISASPIMYLHEHFKLAQIAIRSLARTTSKKDFQELYNNPEKDAFDLSFGMLNDSVFIIIFIFSTLLLFIPYFLLILPIQYFVFLVSGAYSRYTQYSKANEEKFEFYNDLTGKDMVFENVIQEKPFTLTTTIAGVIFEILKLVF